MRFRTAPVVALLLVTGVACTRHAPLAQNTTERTPVSTPPAPVAQPAPTPVVSRTEPTPAPVPRRDYPTEKELAQIDALLARIQDAYFDYDRHNLRPDAEQTLRADAQTLAEIIKQYPSFHLRVEGYCDERGSAEYNFALGDARAKGAKEYLVSLGLPPAQMDTISYGKTRQVCSEDSEDCWQKNRRAHLARVNN